MLGLQNSNFVVPSYFSCAEIFSVVFTDFLHQNIPSFSSRLSRFRVVYSHNPKEIQTSFAPPCVRLSSALTVGSNKRI